MPCLCSNALGQSKNRESDLRRCGIGPPRRRRYPRRPPRLQCRLQLGATSIAPAIVRQVPHELARVGERVQPIPVALLTPACALQSRGRHFAQAPRNRPQGRSGVGPWRDRLRLSPKPASARHGRASIHRFYVAPEARSRAAASCALKFGASSRGRCGTRLSDATLSVYDFCIDIALL